MLMYMSIMTCLYAASASLAPAAADGISVLVDPVAGDDSNCTATLVCASIAYAVRVVGASRVNLTPGVFNESTVAISDVASLVVSGVPSSTIFDCSRRAQFAAGAAFAISNSTVKFFGIDFQHCSNTNGSGGALSAVGSSVTVSQCGFLNCTAANGGAVSATGDGDELFLAVQNSNFTSNSAIGGVVGCPSDSREPCSTWGGAVAALEMSNVSVIGCTMVDNRALAVVPVESQQFGASQNAVAGGGCVSVLFRGNSSASKVHISDNSFLQCTVDVPLSRGIRVGNGTANCSASVCSVAVCARMFTVDPYAQDTEELCR